MEYRNNFPTSFSRRTDLRDSQNGQLFSSEFQFYGFEAGWIGMNDMTKTVRDKQLFNRIALEYCAKDLYSPSRLARVHRLLRTLKGVECGEHARVLEVGCGAGYAATYLEGCYSSFCGIDHAEELIDFAKITNGGESRCFEAVDVNDFEPSERFDVVIMIGVVHHLEDPVNVLARIRTMIKAGGWLVVNEPHPGNPFVSMARAVRKRVDKKYSVDQRELAEDELRKLFISAGYTDINVRAQGVFSTPFAEITLRPRWLMLPAARIACALDEKIDILPASFLKRVSWNLVVAGRA